MVKSIYTIISIFRGGRKLKIYFYQLSIQSLVTKQSYKAVRQNSSTDFFSKFVFFFYQLFPEKGRKGSNP